MSGSRRRLESPGEEITREASPAEQPGGEEEALSTLAKILPQAPAGETWFGDDAAVLVGDPGPLLFATDLVAEGVHFERRHCGLADVGWKALAVNLSDLAAMGGRPLRAVVAVAGAFGGELVELYEGLLEAAGRYDCPVVGGDLSGSPSGSSRRAGIVCTVAVLGTTDGRRAVLRSGGRPGDRLYLTGPVGASAAGLRLLGEGAASGPLVEAHRRPTPRLAEGRLAAELGASAMIDVSDGFGIDLHRLADASGVGVVVDELPVAEGARESEALGGGEDYQLLVCLPEQVEPGPAFSAVGLTAPMRVGTLVADPALRCLRGGTLPAAGYLHGQAQARPPGR